jgi:hypothetical protein
MRFLTYVQEKVISKQICFRSKICLNVDLNGYKIDVICTPWICDTITFKQAYLRTKRWWRVVVGKWSRNSAFLPTSKIHYRAHKTSSYDPILRQLSPVHIFMTYFSKFRFQFYPPIQALMSHIVTCLENLQFNWIFPVPSYVLNMRYVKLPFKYI